MSWQREVIGTCEVYCGDCRDVLPTLGRVDALITDPPYGTGFDFTKRKRRSRGGLRWQSTYAEPPPWRANIVGDTGAFDPAPWLHFPQIIVWGAQQYASRLPDSGGWLVWDKRDGSTPDHHGDCELAWTNVSGVTRLYRLLWRGVCRAGEDNAVHGGKLHPAQKPIELMRWCVAKTTGTVLDPYAGSFTTGVACLQLGRRFIGIEVEPQYFDLGCQRLAEAYRQPQLLPSAPLPPPVQLSLGGVCGLAGRDDRRLSPHLWELPGRAADAGA